MGKRLSLRVGAQRLGVALLACVCASAAVFAADAPPRTVQDPHYGDGLFHFYQERYFTSITTLMVSQHFERVSHHADEAELLRGGMLLSYGLHREAGEIFTALIDRAAAPSVRDRAWFYLAKIRYQRGFLPESEEALARIGKTLPKDLDGERVLLQAQLLMARGDYAGAATVLGALASSGAAGQYARFNLGVAQVKSGQEKEGRALLDGLGTTTLPPEDTDAGALPAEEFASLRDKANLALGYEALQNQKPEDARKYLERVRLEGLQSNKALLGFGWAADSMKDPKLALVPWTELAGRDGSDESVLEARIAVPYAYAELRAYGQALERYNDAITAFERESRDLDESIAAIRSGKLLEALLGGQRADEMGWFWSLDKLPELPHASRLAPVLATHEFQEAFKNYRDLQFLAANLNDWADKLGVFDDMLANRRQAYAERLPKLLAQADAAGLGGLQQRRETLAAELTQAEATSDAAAFADTQQRAQLARLAEVQAALQQAPADADPDSDTHRARERARLIAGALTWNLAQDFSSRLWEAKKALLATGTALEEAQGHQAALAQAQRDEPARFDAFGVRIKALGPRLQALIPRVAALQSEQQKDLQELAVTQLQRQKERLAEYTTQARFAVAQLYDRASLSSGTADHANKP